MMQSMQNAVLHLYGVQIVHRYSHGRNPTSRTPLNPHVGHYIIGTLSSPSTSQHVQHCATPAHPQPCVGTNQLCDKNKGTQQRGKLKLHFLSMHCLSARRQVSTPSWTFILPCRGEVCVCRHGNHTAGTLMIRAPGPAAASVPRERDERWEQDDGSHFPRVNN